MNNHLPVDTRDAARCREIIASLPITNVATAHDILQRLLKAMYEVPPDAVEYLSVLETAREPLAFLQETIASRYAAKPLPASPTETNAFEQTLALWRLMATSYARVAQLGGGNGKLHDYYPLVCHRCIHYAGQTILEYFRARRPVAPGGWVEMHGYYDTAEGWGIAGESVRDPLREADTTCAEAYAAVLLVDLANPYSRTPKELSWIVRWAQMMASSTAVTRPDDDAGGRGYGIDLMQDRGLLPVDYLAGTPSARLFDTSRLGEQVQQLLARLKGGESPADLGLGDDCPALQAGRLLLHLYRPWCLAAMPRRFERNKASGILGVVYEPDSIYFHVCGKEFVQPQHARIFSRTDVQRLWIYRNQLDPTMPLNLRTAQLGYAHDLWEIADQSLNGFRVFRNAAGPRVEHNQLLAVRAPDKETFVLARITWLYQAADGQLHAGIQVLPGPVVGVAIRPTGVAVTAADQYVPGYFLPAVPALKESLSVVLPPGWFNPGRIIEIFTDRPVNARLGELLARGPNFERCSFTLADRPAPAVKAAGR
jgi:cyclic-di-GMP-binding protein